jgi:hypothetical protein
LRYGQAFAIVNKLAHYPNTAPWTEIMQLESYFNAWKSFDPKDVLRLDLLLIEKVCVDLILHSFVHLGGFATVHCVVVFHLQVRFELLSCLFVHFFCF